MNDEAENMRFSVYKNEVGLPTWRILEARSDKLVAWAGETYPSLSKAQEAAERFKFAAAAAKYQVYRDAKGSWRWRAFFSSSIADSGEAFTERVEAEREASLVRSGARYAQGP
jgi:uncharacterized protein YegP (UPF0339 family)